eukprot:GFKZ01001819.1.p1 GENE.GFKZ01001819.1~~GFKZ01001819.1.p1  ORF type:complete len:206 (+),score=30.86 GFKZ01001819.1:181-798(+)
MAFIPTTPLLSRRPTLSPPRHSPYRPSPPLRLSPRCSDMGLSFPERKYDESLRIGVISTRWNLEYISPILTDIKATLSEKGFSDDAIVLMQVPGSFELPVAARLMSMAQKVDAIICLGVLIKGESEHYEYIASAVSKGLMDVQLASSTPIIFGVLCCTTKEQAEARSLGDKSMAKDWAMTAVEMGQLKRSQMGGVSAGKKSVGFF